jgi:hypothetical protein
VSLPQTRQEIERVFYCQVPEFGLSVGSVSLSVWRYTQYSGVREFESHPGSHPAPIVMRPAIPIRSPPALPFPITLAMAGAGRITVGTAAAIDQSAAVTANAALGKSIVSLATTCAWAHHHISPRKN